MGGCITGEKGRVGQQEAETGNKPVLSQFGKQWMVAFRKDTVAQAVQGCMVCVELGEL